MNIQSLNFILSEQTKGNYAVISEVVNNMTKEEYEEIPIFELTKDVVDFFKFIGFYFFFIWIKFF